MSAIEHVHSGKEIASELKHHKLQEAQHELRYDYLHMNRHAFNKVVNAMQTRTHGLGVEHDKHGNVVALNFDHHHIFSAPHSKHERTEQQHHGGAHSQSELHRTNSRREQSQRRNSSEKPPATKETAEQKKAEQAEQEVEKKTWANTTNFSDVLPAKGGQTVLKGDQTITTWGQGDQQITRTINADKSGTIVGHNLQIGFHTAPGEYSESRTTQLDNGSTQTITREFSGKTVTNIEPKGDPSHGETKTEIPGPNGAGTISYEWGKPVKDSTDGTTRENGCVETGDGNGNCTVKYRGVDEKGKPNPPDYTVTRKQLEDNYQVTYEVKDGKRHYVKDGKELFTTVDSDLCLVTVDNEMKSRAEKEKEKPAPKPS
jgi:hypothetical protein